MIFTERQKNYITTRKRLRMETSKSKLKLNVLRKVGVNEEDKKQTDNSG
jgi:hypothetical protein